MGIETGDITTASAVSNFQNLITIPVNGIAGKWTSTNHPGGIAVPGYPTLSNSVPTPIASALLAGDTMTGAPVAGTLGSGNISLAVLTSVFVSAASTLSQARNATLNKFYQVGVTQNLYSSVTNVAHLTTTYAKTTGWPTLSTGDIDSTAFDVYVSALQTAVSDWRNATVTFTEYWCHSNCHASHSSRGRR